MFSLAVRIVDWPLQTWKPINGEAITGPVGSTTGEVVVVINVGSGGVSVEHPLLGA